MLLNLQNIIDIKEVLLQWFIDFLKKRQLKGRTVENKNISNKKSAEQLHKPLFKKFKKRKVNSSFIDNIWWADLAGMLLISKFNKGFRYLLCMIDIYSKHAWVIPL